MGLNLEILNPLTHPGWDDLLTSFPEHSFFHTSAWAKVLSESYGFIPHYFVAFRENKIIGIQPLMQVRDIFGRKKAVSLPFSDFCEPLFIDRHDFNTTFDHIISIARKYDWQSIELRGGEQWLANKPFYDEMYTHEIDLNPQSDSIFKSFTDTTRRNIRKAEKSGVIVRHESSLEATKLFYQLNCLTRRDHGLPPQPRKFFQELWETIISQGNGFITTASYRDRAIAGNIYLIFGNDALYKYGASNRTFQNLRPSNLIMWEGIKHSRKLGCFRLNLGRTEKHHIGLLRYKRGFNGKETTVRYFQFDTFKGKYVLGSTPHSNNVRGKILSKLPLLVLRLIGKALYKYYG